MKPLLILLCLAAGNLLYAQSPLPQFGVYSADEINLKECPFDKNAGAIVLLDEAVSEHDDDYQLITRRRVRIKIFDKRELDLGQVDISEYSKDDFETITDIQAQTTNYDNGRPAVSLVDKKSIFTEKKDNFYSSIHFAMPAVKPGSIIEYQYVSTKKHYGGLRPWVFQHEIPTLKSCYLLTIIPGAEFAYNVQKKSNYPVILKHIPDQGKVYFEMNNIPGLRFEPYMDAVKDYLQRVEFQLSSYTTRYGSKTKVNQSWGDLAYELITDKDFGGAIRKNLSNTGEIKELVARETTDSGKIAAIYKFVRDNFTANEYVGIYSSEGLKSTWQKRTGTATEINFVLLNLLQSYNFECYPLLAAERNFGKIDTTYPFTDRFNKVVALVKCNGRLTVMDASDKDCPPGLTPYPLLNTTAFIVDRKAYNLVKIITNTNGYNNLVTVDAAIDEKGMMKATANVSSTSYARLIRAAAIRRDRKKFVKDVIQEAVGEALVDDVATENLDDDRLPLTQIVKFHNELNPSGGFVFFSPNLFTGIPKNPFTAQERFTNINFAYPINVDLKINLQLPPKAGLDKLPGNKSVVSLDQSIIVTRTVTQDGNKLIIHIGIRQSRTLFNYSEYPDLKALYVQILDLLNEPFVIKLP
jgi:hypothetical protein